MGARLKVSNVKSRMVLVKRKKLGAERINEERETEKGRKEEKREGRKVREGKGRRRERCDLYSQRLMDSWYFGSHSLQILFVNHVFQRVSLPVRTEQLGQTSVLY